MIKFVCNRCGQKLGVSDGHAGKRVRCTSCREPVHVPAIETPPARPVDWVALEEGERAAQAAPVAIAPPPPAPRAKGPSCPKCKGHLNEGAVICVRCGHNLRIGVNAKTVARAQLAASITGRTGLTIGAAIIAAVAGGAVWAGIVVATGYEVGYVAIGIGLLVGLVVAIGARGQSEGVGVLAAGVAVVGLLVGKLLIFQWGVPSVMTEMLEKEPTMLQVALMQRMAVNEEFDAEIQAALDSDDGEMAPELEARLNEAVQARFAELDDSQRKELGRWMADQMLTSVSIADRLKATLSWWDLLWGVLAVSTAYRVASGTAGEE